MILSPDYISDIAAKGRGNELFFFYGRIRTLATYSFYRLKMGIVEIDDFSFLSQLEIFGIYFTEMLIE